MPLQLARPTAANRAIRRLPPGIKKTTRCTVGQPATRRRLKTRFHFTFFHQLTRKRSLRRVLPRKQSLAMPVVEMKRSYDCLSMNGETFRLSTRGVMRWYGARQRLAVRRSQPSNRLNSARMYACIGYNYRAATQRGGGKEGGRVHFAVQTFLSFGCNHILL
jgi:hypothetical protein